ncbi:PilT/PilU family type 4a pilus ATPase [Helicobacter sp. 13S00477-4]|uniref:type IV pilus twitching motility protein PilT n=1 Tax=Helicobacter sp. 13S00477-4 TaxID=1905759 RepID=UPI000BA50259|nr:PilT/PilU family type 4a pilus ATPase [Helicobacter sp. 13S00477-4]PAF52314.1 hypothetical protein BKH44_03130 [Helicobacter sp. 13S00477-4]
MQDHKFEKILSEAITLKASDIHILANGEVFFRVTGSVIAFGVLSIEDLENIIGQLLTEHQIQECQNGIEIDTSISYGEVRLRLNCYLTQSCKALSIRVLPNRIPSMQELFLPEVLKDIFAKKEGLILVSGPTGSGKSTTIATALEYVNMNFNKHIICIEDPIEYLHQNIKSFFSYREVGKDSLSFERAIHASLRQDPDIVLVGELRGMDSIRAALLASQTGHLVVGSTHSSDSAGTLSRIINSFENNRSEIATELSCCLQAIISQKLVCIGNGVLRGIYEVLIATPAIRTLIREQKFHQIPSQIAMGKEFGMVSFEESMKKLNI